MSKYKFLSEIAARLDLNASLIKPVLIDDFGFRAKRSKKLNLNVSKLANDLSVGIPSVAHSIESFVRDFKRGIPETIKSNGYQKNIYPASLEMISYGRQFIDEEDIAAVVEVLKSKSITQGPKVREFESALCQTTGASFAIAVNSGTSALHIACLAAGIGPDDEVITSPNTFVASANCVAYCKGTPILPISIRVCITYPPGKLKKRSPNGPRRLFRFISRGRAVIWKPLQRSSELVKKIWPQNIHYRRCVPRPWLSL